MKGRAAECESRGVSLGCLLRRCAWGWWHALETANQGENRAYDAEINAWADGCHYTLPRLGGKAADIAVVGEKDCAGEESEDGRSKGVNAPWLAFVEDRAEEKEESDSSCEDAVALIAGPREGEAEEGRGHSRPWEKGADEQT